MLGGPARSARGAGSVRTALGIVQSLHDHDGNKVRSAGALGMSRATIYRKIREYGIVASGS